MAKLFKSVVKSPLLSATVEAEIEKSIRSGKLLPGGRLPSEMELCEQFGVSRTAIREALRMLSARGLISIEKGRGIFISHVSADTVVAPMELYLHLNQGPEYGLDVVHARQLIEPPVAAQAALHHTSEDVERLQRDLERLDMASRDDHGLLTELDMSFHMHVARASHNPVIPLLLHPIHLLMPGIKAGVYDVVSDARESARLWHGLIVAAVLARDPQEAHRAMSGHLVVAEQHVRQASAAREPVEQAA